MKKLFFLFSFLFSVSALSQTDPELDEFIQEFEDITDSLGIDWDISDTVSLSLDEIRDTLFSLIDMANYSTDRLFDRTLESRYLISLFNGAALLDTLNYFYWNAFYEQIRLSELNGSTLLPIEENLMAGIDFINSIDIEKDIIEYPVGIIFLKYNFWNFTDNDQFEDGVTTINYQIHENNNIADYIDTGLVFAVQPLIDLNIEGEFYLTLPENFIISDYEINSIEVDYGFGFEILSSANPVLVRAIDSLTIFNFRLMLSDSSFFYCKSAFENEGFGTRTRDHEYDHPDSDENITINGIKMKIGYYYACEQETLYQMEKPVILIPGYQPRLVHRFLPGLYRQENHVGLLDDLRSSGHTVIVVAFWPGFKDLIDESYLVEHLINRVNSIKMSDGADPEIIGPPVVYSEPSFYENVIIGYSAGGQCTRMALNRMEENTLIYNAPHHHTKLYCSFDSPHYGGHLPLADQYAAEDLKSNYPTILSQVVAFYVNVNVNTIGSKQLSRYFKTGGESTIPDIDRANFLNEMYSYDHPKTNPAVPGFPTFTRNIAVVLGRFDGVKLENYNPGDQLFGKLTLTAPFNSGLGGAGVTGVINYERIRTWSSLYASNHTVYKRYLSAMYYVIPVFYTAEKKSNYSYEFDNAAGSYRSEMHKATNTAIRLRPWSGVGINYFDNSVTGENYEMCFIPSVSGLAINEIYWGADASFDFHTMNLMFDSFDDDINVPSQQSSFSGYPHLGNPTNHFSITPFEAFYINQENEKHIATHGHDDAVTAVDLKFFLYDEIYPYITVLQNYKTGWNTNSAQVYTAWYHGLGQVIIGNLVTPKTDPGDYIIEENANIRVTSDNLIHMYPGFHAQAGCEFHAYIASENCTSGHAPEFYDDDEETEKAPIETNKSNKPDNLNEEEHTIFTIIPNPNSGNFTLSVFGTVNETTQVTLFDLSGKVIFSGPVFFTRTDFDLVLEKGIYLVVLTQNEKTQTQKLVIQ